jgi:hypothetical protein
VRAAERLFGTLAASIGMPPSTLSAHAPTAAEHDGLAKALVDAAPTMTSLFSVGGNMIGVADSEGGFSAPNFLAPPFLATIEQHYPRTADPPVRGVRSSQPRPAALPPLPAAQPWTDVERLRGAVADVYAAGTMPLKVHRREGCDLATAVAASVLVGSGDGVFADGPTTRYAVPTHGLTRSAADRITGQLRAAPAQRARLGPNEPAPRGCTLHAAPELPADANVGREDVRYPLLSAIPRSGDAHLYRTICAGR